MTTHSLLKSAVISYYPGTDPTNTLSTIPINIQPMPMHCSRSGILVPEETRPTRTPQSTTSIREHEPIYASLVWRSDHIDEIAVAMSRYAALQSDEESDAGRNSTSEETQLQVISLPVTTSNSAAPPPRQSGGTYAHRSDPITGVNWLDSSPVDIGFSMSDIDACTRVVEGLGEAVYR